MTNKRNLLKKGFIMFLVVLMTLVAIPQKGEAAYSTITSSKNVNYSMDIVKSDIKYNVFKNAPYNLPNSTLVADSVNFIGSKYQAVKEVVTDNSRTWVNFKDLNGTEIGWVDKNAVKQGANFRTVTASKVVNYSMEIVPTEITYNVYSNGPHNTPNSALVNNSSAYFKQSFRAVKEVETDSERTWVNFVDSTGKDMGWIDLNAVQSNEKMTKPVVTSHKLTSNTGYLNLKWEPRANAVAYKVGFFNGYNYQYVNVGNVTSWSTQGKKIWATNEDLAVGKYQLHVDGAGSELPIDPLRTYVSANKANPSVNYTDRLYYYARVVAVYANGESPVSDANTATMPLSSIDNVSTISPAIDETSGVLSIEWDAVSQAVGYKVWIFDGKIFHPYDVKNNLGWSSQGKGIWPSADDTNQGRKELYDNGLGSELAINPAPVYHLNNPDFATTTDYYTRVTAYDVNGDTIALHQNQSISMESNLSEEDVIDDDAFGSGIDQGVVENEIGEKAEYYDPEIVADTPEGEEIEFDEGPPMLRAVVSYWVVASKTNTGKSYGPWRIGVASKKSNATGTLSYSESLTSSNSFTGTLKVPKTKVDASVGFNITKSVTKTAGMSVNVKKNKSYTIYHRRVYTTYKVPQKLKKVDSWTGQTYYGSTSYLYLKKFSHIEFKSVEK
ncbi:SH3-like domain-containing protein [Listeria newyorkensis]|uniref:GW domain-containing protein n=1 Tax=Listeria newyorkensis TaxID=1497681 RepID=A0A841Z108_9LIST|nr:SH3-like domain-containing protein [Listeria newyorkensis]MBC1458507.1 hypothetical protein [Listeria newyorkensis]